MPDGLPSWEHVVLGVTAVAALIGAAVKGWRSNPKSGSNAPNVLVAGEIMDTRPMRDLVKSVDRQTEQNERVEEAINRMVAAEARTERAIRDMIAAFERSKQ